MKYSIIWFLAEFLTPFIIAVGLFKVLKSYVRVKGPWLGLTINLGGGAAAYFIVWLAVSDAIKERYYIKPIEKKIEAWSLDFTVQWDSTNGPTRYSMARDIILRFKPPEAPATFTNKNNEVAYFLQDVSYLDLSKSALYIYHPDYIERPVNLSYKGSTNAENPVEIDSVNRVYKILNPIKLVKTNSMAQYSGVTP